jgi:hypothetical protein
MSKQYEQMIQILSDQNYKTDELKARNRARMRPDLVGDNDVA